MFVYVIYWATLGGIPILRTALEKPKGLCNNYQEGGGAEKLELSSKNLDSTPLQNKKN